MQGYPSPIGYFRREVNAWNPFIKKHVTEAVKNH